MSYQTKEEAVRTVNDINEEEKTDHQKASKPERTVLKPLDHKLRILLLVVLCAACFGAGSYLGSRIHDPFLKIAKPGYLSLNEYVLNDTDGSPVQKSSVSEFQDMYTFTYAFDIYSTTRGISIGDSWEAFVEAYGDTYAYEITCDNKVLETEKPITVSEFQAAYIDTGRIDLNTSELEVQFMTGTDGSNLCYSDMDMERAKDQKENTPSLLKRMDSNQIRFGRFTLSFVFTSTEDGSTVDFIYSGFHQS